MYRRIAQVLDSKPVRITVIILGILLVFFGYWIFDTANAEIQNAIDPLRGQLNPPLIDPLQPIQVALSGSIGNYTISELSEGIDLTKLICVDTGNGSFQFPIQITFDNNNRLLVSARFTDKDGSILAIINNNEWKAVSSNSMEIWDKNYNSYAFEIVDNNGFPALQILVAEKNQIRIGYSLISNGLPYVFTVKPSMYTLGNLTDTELTAHLRSDTLFKYPSREHLGEMNSVYLIPDFSNFDGTQNEKTYNNNPLALPTYKQWAGISMIIFGSSIEAFVGIETMVEKRRKDRLND